LLRPFRAGQDAINVDHTENARIIKKRSKTTQFIKNLTKHIAVKRIYLQNSQKNRFTHNAVNRFFLHYIEFLHVV